MLYVAVLFALVSAVVVHEAGHLTVAAVCGFRHLPLGRKDRWHFLFWGAGMSSWQFMAIAVAGPAANFVWAAGVWHWSAKVGAVSMFMGVVSLVPLGSLDGSMVRAAVRELQDKVYELYSATLPTWYGEPDDTPGTIGQWRHVRMCAREEQSWPGR